MYVFNICGLPKYRKVPGSSVPVWIVEDYDEVLVTVHSLVCRQDDSELTDSFGMFSDGIKLIK